MIKRCVIVDTETTGLEPTTDQVIELAAVLYSIEHRSILCAYSSLIPLEEGETNPAEPVNRIPTAALAGPFNWFESGVWDAIEGAVLETADCIVAHNAEFDRSFLPAWSSLPWCCTKSDFRWPLATKENPSLINLALEHGIGVGSAHRALTDCLLIAQLFDRMHLFGCDLQEMFAHAMRPKAKFQAMVSYEDRELAKRAGFQWQAETKQWLRQMAIADAQALAFPVRQLQGAV